MVIVYTQKQSGIDVFNIPPGDRWLLFEELDELYIHCWFAEDGCLWVELSDRTTALQFIKVIKKFVLASGPKIPWRNDCVRLA